MKINLISKNSLFTLVLWLLLINFLAGEKTFDLNLWSGNINISGKNSFDQFGKEIATGDVNGDGIADIMISSPSADPLGRNSAGEVYIFFGSDAAQENVSIDLNNTNADITIRGSNSGDKLGYSLAVGNFNGDNLADFAISAPYSNNGNISQAGKVYVFYGSQSFPEIIDLAIYSANHIFTGESTNDYLGQELLFSDLNNNGEDELIIAAPEADYNDLSNCGKVYLLWSQETYAQTVNISQATNISFLAGTSINDNFGKSIASGNFNNDSFQDLLVGIPGYDYDDSVNCGQIILIKGRTFFPYQEINITNPTYISSNFIGENHSAKIGKSMAVGDLNGDGYADLTSTDFSEESSANLIYIIYGSNSAISEIVLNSENADVVLSHQGIQDHLFGEKLAIANLRTGSPADLIIASPLASSNNGYQSGLVHVLYGRSIFESAYDFALDLYDEIYHGEVANAKLGSSLQLADFNHDGKADIWIGAEEASNNRGKVYSILGGIPWVWNLLPSAGATNVDIDQTIAFSLSDDQELDLSSILVNIAGTDYDVNSSNLSYSGSGNFYRITISPQDYFGYDQIINVSILANDSEGWSIPTSNYGFFTREDTDPPFTNQWLPAPNAQGVAVDTNIEFNVYDLGEGVNLSSIVANIDGTNYYSGSPYFSYLGEVNNLRIIVSPPNNFAFGQEVFVSLDCQDLAPIPNVMATFNYSFICGEDNSSPSIIHIEPAYGEEVARTNPIYVEVADSESSLNQNSINFSLDGVSLLAESLVEELPNGRLRIYYNPLENQLLTYGEKSLYFYIEDSSNNANSIDTTSIFTVVPDNQAPYTANHYPERFSVDNATNTQFKVDLFDLLSGIDISSLSVKINGTEISGSNTTTISSLNNGYRVIYNPPSRLLGEVTVEIQVGDLETPANVMPLETYTFTTSPDTEAPYISDLYPAEAAINIPIDANLRFKIFDNKTGVDINSLQVLIDGSDVSENLNTAPITNGFDVLYLLDYPYNFNQLVNVYIACSDREEPANTYENNYYFRITPDLEAPYLINMNPQANESSVPIDKTIYFEIFDNGLGVDISTLQLKVDNEIVEAETNLIEGTMFYSVSYKGDDFQYGQEVRVLVNVSDLASNPNQLTNFNYTFRVVDDDQSPPIFTGLTPAENSEDNPVDSAISMFIIDAESEVDANSVIFKINNETISDYALEPVSNEDGNGFRLYYQPSEYFGYDEIVRIQIYAMDTSSNNNSANKSYSFTTEVDDVPPYLELASPADGGDGYANSILYLSLKDDLSGIDKDSFSLIINGEYIANYQDSLHDQKLEVWYSTEAFFGFESVDIEFSVADKVGNNYDDSYSFTIIPDTFPPYFLWLNPQLNTDIANGDFLEIAILDKGVGIAEESIEFRINGFLIENYNLDRTTYNTNPDSLGLVLTYQVDNQYYPGQGLTIDIEASDKNQPLGLENNATYNLFVKKDINLTEVEVVPNIISLNFDGVNDYCRIIIPSPQKAKCKIFTLDGKEVADLKTSDYLPEQSNGKHYQVAIWDGHNRDRKAVNAGIYICQVKYAGKVHRNTITVAK